MALQFDNSNAGVINLYPGRGPVTPNSWQFPSAQSTSAADRLTVVDGILATTTLTLTTAVSGYSSSLLTTGAGATVNVSVFTAAGTGTNKSIVLAARPYISTSGGPLTVGALVFGFNQDGTTAQGSVRGNGSVEISPGMTRTLSALDMARQQGSALISCDGNSTAGVINGTYAINASCYYSFNQGNYGAGLCMQGPTATPDGDTGQTTGCLNGVALSTNGPANQGNYQARMIGAYIGMPTNTQGGSYRVGISNGATFTSSATAPTYGYYVQMMTAQSTGSTFIYFSPTNTNSTTSAQENCLATTLQYTANASDVMYYEILVVATQAGTGAIAKAWRISTTKYATAGVVFNGVVTTTVLFNDASASTWTVSDVSVPKGGAITYGGLSLNTGGVASVSIDWVARVEMVVTKRV